MKKERITRYHIVSTFGGGKREQLIYHKLTPLILTGDGKIWLAICTISLTAGDSYGNAIMKKHGTNTFYKYSLLNHNWEKQDEIVMTKNEKEVLVLSAHGYTTADIADIICKSIDSVKFYKRVMFQKMGVKNIVEALTYAQNHQLI